MTKHTLSPRKIVVTLFAAFVAAVMQVPSAMAQQAQTPKPLIISHSKETIQERLNRKIALDVRDMNIVDVLKFLAMKGEFNVVISPSVDGRTTVLLDNVAIKDALDIVIISNRLAYSIQNNIVQIMSAAEYEAMFGKQFSDKTVVATLRLQYAKPSYVLAALDNVKSNVGKIIIDEDTGAVVLIDTPESIEKMKRIVTEIEQPLDTVIYNLQYAKADVVADKLRSRIDAKSVGSISADERSNQLVVRVFPGRKDEVEKIIRHLDEPTKEVLIEARILQVIFKPNFDTGIDWGVLANSDKPDKSLKFTNMYLNESGLSSSDNLTNTFGKIAVGNINVDNFSVSLRSLEQVSDTKLLSNPKIMAVNNEESRIHIGDTVPYIISTVSGTGDNAITSEDVRFIDVGLKLNVTPIINDDGMITMRLRPEISSVVGRLESTKGGIPEVNKTEVETTLLVEDGTTIIMAGLRKDDKVHTKKGFPILMDIPFIEKAFSRVADSISSSEIVIFITPHILTGKENYKAPDGTIKPSKAYNK
ncbi:MAG: secretin N-terminal domain-containing protein [Candidatus Omnitrophota bacterium]